MFYRVCNEHETDTKQQTPAKETTKKKGQAKAENSARSAQIQENYEPYRGNKEQAPYEELRKSKITSDTTLEKYNWQT